MEYYKFCRPGNEGIREAAKAVFQYFYGLVVIDDPQSIIKCANKPEGIFRFEWTNSRGAIARFDRQTIEIRVIDIQECPLADLSILTAISQLVKHLVAIRRH